MKLDAETLRSDLILYHETAWKLGLPTACRSLEELHAAGEAEMVDMAATLGWDFAKYVEADDLTRCTVINSFIPTVSIFGDKA